MGSRIYHGDDYGEFLAANASTLPLGLFLENHVAPRAFFILVITFDFVCMIGLGSLLDLVRTPFWIYLLFPLVWLAITPFIPMTPPYFDPPLSHVLLLAWAPAIYILTVACLVLTPLAHMGR